MVGLTYHLLAVSAPYLKKPGASTDLVRAPWYSVGCVALASLLGGPLAGCILLAANYRANGCATAFRVTLALGFLATVGLMVLAVLLLPQLPLFFVPFVVAGGMAFLAAMLPPPTDPEPPGLAPQSLWRAAGIGLSIFLAIGIMVFVVLVLLRY